MRWSNSFKNGFKIWAHIKSLHDKAITSNASAILPFLLLKILGTKLEIKLGLSSYLDQ